MNCECVSLPIKHSSIWMSGTTDYCLVCTKVNVGSHLGIGSRICSIVNDSSKILPILHGTELIWVTIGS